MPRRKSFDPADAVRAARDRFWEHGYEGTSLTDLEHVTGLNRSSLYQAFGGKRELFELSVQSYLTEIAWPRLARLERPGAGPAEVARYFAALAETLDTAPHEVAGRGCLVVNTITELAPHDPAAHAAGAGYRTRIRTAFDHALGRGRPDERTGRRADLLVGVLVGLLVVARLAPAEAAALARATAEEITDRPAAA